MDMSEKNGAMLSVIVIAFLFGPVYLILLTIGIIRRKQLAAHPLARWTFILGLPVGLLSCGLVSVFGTDAINTTSDAGRSLSSFGLTVMLLGAVAGIVIMVQTWRAHRRSKRNVVQK